MPIMKQESKKREITIGKSTQLTLDSVKFRKILFTMKSSKFYNPKDKIKSSLKLNLFRLMSMISMPVKMTNLESLQI